MPLTDDERTYILDRLVEISNFIADRKDLNIQESIVVACAGLGIAASQLVTEMEVYYAISETIIRLATYIEQHLHPQTVKLPMPSQN